MEKRKPTFHDGQILGQQTAGYAVGTQPRKYQVSYRQIEALTCWQGSCQYYHKYSNSGQSSRVRFHIISTLSIMLFKSLLLSIALALVAAQDLYDRLDARDSFEDEFLSLLEERNERAQAGKPAAAKVSYNKFEKPKMLIHPGSRKWPSPSRVRSCSGCPCC